MAQVSVSAILVEERLRAVDSDWVEYIAGSIEVSGLLQPVVVSRDGQGRYKLIDGAHRLASVKRLGWETIEARVLDMAETERRLAEVDANLVRRDLSLLDRGKFLAERRSLVASLRGSNLRETQDNSPVGHGVPNQDGRRAFDAQTAAKLGISERYVRYLAGFHTRIAPDLVARLSPTVFAGRSNELKALCRLRPEVQRKVVELLTDQEKPCGSVRQALVALGERPAQPPRADLLLSAAKAAAGRLDPSGRAAFIAWLKQLKWI